MVVLIAFGTWYYLDLTRNLPAITILPAIFEPPDGELLQPTRIYDRTDEHVILTLQNPAATGRQYLFVRMDDQTRADQFSPNLLRATIAALDPGFWNEAIFSLKGLAGIKDPTLAQQLVADNLLYNVPKSQRRNSQEWLLAGQVTAQYGRIKVLEWYLNSAKYGDFVYGADAAARVYLGKPATDLTNAEAALIAAINAFPELNPWSDRQVLWNQQVWVIQKMLEYGLIGTEDAEEALRENIQIQPEQIMRSLAPAYTNLVLLQLGAQFPLERIFRGGFEIITTMDYDIQTQADCIVQEQIDRMFRSSDQNIDVSGLDCKAVHSLSSAQLTEGNRTQESKVEVIVLQPQTGEILAYVGGEDADPLATAPAEHSAGSILSPFLYLTGFVHGLSPASLLWDLPTNDARINNPEDLASYHGPVSLRTALVNDYRGAAFDVINQVGMNNIYTTEREFGINPTSGMTTTVGTERDFFAQRVSLLDTVQAYAVLANQGVMAGQHGIAYSQQSQNELKPSSLIALKDSSGKSWLDLSNAHVQPIVSSQLAYLITNVLSKEKVYRTVAGISEPLVFGRPVAFKIGSDENGENGWTIGYIPQLAVGVWMQDMQPSLSKDIAAKIWKSIMEVASSNQPVINFTAPEGISQLQVCDPSGLLVTPACPIIVDEVFLTGSEPMHTDDLYQEFLIDKQTGLLATIFTPPEQVEKKVYLVVPVEVANWAKEAKLPIPPEKYDEINITGSTSNDANIMYPTAFAQVGGRIVISGSATGNDFSYYRVEVGQGLNPQQWLQVGEDMHQPIQGGILATWDTTGLAGEYIIELLVVRKDLQVEHFVLPVVVDNHAPQLHIVEPTPNQQFSQQADQYLIFQVMANDDQAIKQLEIYVDNEIVSTLYNPPFIVPWMSVMGKHTLLAKAYDLAGHSTTNSIEFSVNP